MSACLLHLEGDGDKSALPPISVVNDYLVSWFMTAGIAEAPRRHAVDGGSYRVHVSLSVSPRGSSPRSPLFGTP
ncbi:hypothetical protein [Streptomyces sp. NPDC058683]|uniref:hypothetical protein n=1 Tax=Streptomyces sp. NPDC058683 TaxID=3346597 RepID=UPI003655489C